MKTRILVLLVLVGFMGHVWAADATSEDGQYAQTITVAQDGSGDYKTITEALKKLRGDFEDPVRILIKDGKYDEKVLVNYTLKNITIEGESRKGTIISHGDYASLNNMGTSESYTMRIDGNNITLKNLTIENIAGQVGQAVALHTTGDKIHVVDCDILGNQDTLYATGQNSRDLFDNCYIEGTVDFIFGAATALFRNCHLHAKRDGYLTAASTPKENGVGYVFDHCTVTADPEAKNVYLGRPWRPYASTFFINCKLPEAIHEQGWHNWGKEENEKTARYGEYRSSGPGAKEDKRVGWRKTLNALDAAELTDPGRIFARNSVWIPE